MTENRKHHLLIALLMLAGVILIALSLPRSTGQMGALLSHEVGKPWRNPTLIAPFDIPCEYDEATKQRITDSVNANFVHFYRLNTQLGNQKVVLLNQALTGESAVPAGTRQGHLGLHILTKRETDLSADISVSLFFSASRCLRDDPSDKKFL